MSEPTSSAGDFIADAVRADNASGRFGGRVQTRFPPEPNGYLHIGHAKAIITVTHSGETARLLCKYRPSTPIIACVMHEKIYRQLGLSWGITPIIMPLAKTIATTVVPAVVSLLQKKVGDKNEPGFNLESILGNLTGGGGKSASGGLGSLLGGLGGLLGKK